MAKISKIGLVFLTLGIIVQRASIALGNAFLGLALAGVVYSLYSKHKIGETLMATEYKVYYKSYAFFLICLLPSVLFAGQFNVSIKNFFEMWIYRFMPFVIVTCLVRDKQFLKKCLLGILCYISFDSTVSFVQMLLLHGARTWGIGGGFLRFASIIVTVLPIVLILWLEPKKDFPGKKFMPILFVGLCLGMLGLQSRGAWVATVLVLPIILGKYLRHDVRKLGVLVAIVVCVSSTFIFSQHFSQRLESITNITTDRSNGDRVEAWKSAWVMFKERPIVGWGLNQSNKPYLEHYRSPAETQGLSHFHNNYVEMLVNTGVIGFLGYVSFLGYMFWLHRRFSSSYNMMIFCMLLTFSIFGLIEYNIDLSASIKTFWFVLGALVCLKDKET